MKVIKLWLLKKVSVKYKKKKVEKWSSTIKAIHGVKP